MRRGELRIERDRLLEQVVGVAERCALMNQRHAAQVEVVAV